MEANDTRKRNRGPADAVNPTFQSFEQVRPGIVNLGTTEVLARLLSRTFGDAGLGMQARLHQASGAVTQLDDYPSAPSTAELAVAHAC